MAGGGRRPGAGRKPGSAAKIDDVLRARALKDGAETPLEYMLRVMRDTKTNTARRDHMAISAAPYLHAKLAHLQHTGAGGGSILVEVVRYADPATAPVATPDAPTVATQDPPAK